MNGLAARGGDGKRCLGEQRGQGACKKNLCPGQDDGNDNRQSTSDRIWLASQLFCRTIPWILVATNRIRDMFSLHHDRKRHG